VLPAALKDSWPTKLSRNKLNQFVKPPIMKSMQAVCGAWDDHKVSIAAWSRVGLTIQSASVNGESFGKR